LTSISSLPRRRKPSRGSQPYRPRELREQRVRPDKSLGQHFLTDYGVVRRILEAADPAGLDALIEVGPGLGVLTGQLALIAKRLIAVELDRELAAKLRERFAGNEAVIIVEADVLSLSPAELLQRAGLDISSRYAVVGNLPYNAGTAIVRHFLEAEAPPRWLVVMLQREVAESICSAPGELGVLGVSVQVYAEPRRLFTVPPRAFYPPPRVTSSVIRIDLRPVPLIGIGERERFFRVLRAGFSAPRKRLRNSLAQSLDRSAGEVEALIIAAGLDPAARPGELSVADWIRLANAMIEV
jgi:16S rRNA (adenine1518-N6/adenine1519-N6)-dimethyltransferase